ncbi:hypothetical protein P3T76_009480 [Phytophthora citrophthora]|uniref:ISXO2-like transposase domain-containing protein n=1 Tax=Phytophthora citrophthora TaxID=4793 RepID=A0AAD9GGL9_9STRA|nr:hypothetical protein P3T76_009480 [Phytophthora citrophthora]
MAYNYNLQRLHRFDFSAVMEATTKATKAAAWVMQLGLLEKSMFCPQCTQPMRLNAQQRYWRCCRKTRHTEGKQEQCSIFVSSWSSQMKLTLPQALRLRVLCSKEILKGEIKIGGDGHIVENNETRIKKKSKYGRGRYYQEFWLFGGVDRSNGQWLGQIMYDERTKEMLLPLIKKFIRPRTRIHSNMCATYVAERGSSVHTLANNRVLASMQYEHRWVNYTLNIVGPVTGTHTNTIEGLWETHIKRHVKAMRGISKKHLDGYIDEFMWGSWFFPPRSSPGDIMCGLVQAVIRHPTDGE